MYDDICYDCGFVNCICAERRKYASEDICPKCGIDEDYCTCKESEQHHD